MALIGTPMTQLHLAQALMKVSKSTYRKNETSRRLSPTWQKDFNIWSPKLKFGLDGKVTCNHIFDTVGPLWCDFTVIIYCWFRLAGQFCRWQFRSQILWRHTAHSVQARRVQETTVIAGMERRTNGRAGPNDKRANAWNIEYLCFKNGMLAFL